MLLGYRLQMKSLSACVQLSSNNGSIPPPSIFHIITQEIALKLQPLAIIRTSCHTLRRRAHIQLEISYLTFFFQVNQWLVLLAEADEEGSEEDEEA